MTQVSTGSRVDAAGGRDGLSRCTGPARRRGAAARPSAGRAGWRPPSRAAARTRCRHASMPAAVPALVSTGPSSTYRASHSTLAAGNRRLQLVDVAPVGRATPTVEQAGLAEQERAGAHRQHARATVGRAPQDSAGPRPERPRRWGAPARRPGRPRSTGARSACGVIGEAGRRPYRPALMGADREVVRGQTIVAPVGAEHLAEHAEFERRDSVAGDVRRPFAACDDSYPRRWQEVEVAWHYCHCPHRYRPADAVLVSTNHRHSRSPPMFMFAVGPLVHRSRSPSRPCSAAPLDSRDGSDWAATDDGAACRHL